MICAVCGAEVPVSQPLTWRCPHAAVGGEPHVLRIVPRMMPLRAGYDANPFVAFRPYLMWSEFAEANGFDADAQVERIRQLDAEVEAVAGTGFRWTPFGRADALSDALGFSEDGGVWVKNETGNVAGTHKARHLFTVALHLLLAEERGLAPWRSRQERPPLAIASCGNAALAAATLAAAMEWPISVFVPVWANEHVVRELVVLGATTVRCPRIDGEPPGDPCVLRFRDAVAAGAIPFAVQGPENAWCLDGGRTVGWELAIQFERQAPMPLDRLIVQAGGGALAACAWQGAAALGTVPKLHAVQTEGCAPLARAWELAQALPDGPRHAGAHWRDCMWPWEREPASAADGILDDEAYDWVEVVDAMACSGGSPVVAPESIVMQAWQLGRATTEVPVSATGTAGLAGLMAMREQIGDDENVAVIFSGVER